MNPQVRGIPIGDSTESTEESVKYEHSQCRLT